MSLIEKEIQSLKDDLQAMATLVQKQLKQCTEAILSQDPKLIKKVRKKERKINRMDIEIESRCEKIIALHQPVAKDLRFLFAAIKMNLYLEQMGDNAKSITQYINQLQQPIAEEVQQKAYLHSLMERVLRIVALAIEAFLEEDAQKAKQVFIEDDSIDRIHRYDQRLFVQLIQQNPAATSDYLQLLAIIKHLEKIADHCIHIAEDTLYYLEGIYYRHSKLKKAPFS